MVLDCFWGPVFVPLPSKPLNTVSIQTLFWLFGHGQVSWGDSGPFFIVALRVPELSLSCLPDFVADT